MSWKVGDKVKFIENGQDDSTDDYALTLGSTYNIIHKLNCSSGNYSDGEYKYAIENDEGAEWWIEPDSFELVKRKKIKNDIQWLDAIQENFKNGF